MEFISPASKDEALDVLGRLGPDATVLAGGTDVMVQYLRGEIAPGHLVYIGGLDALDGIAADGHEFSIGALTPHRRLATDPLVLDLLPAVSAAAATVGGWQTQAVGTIGGNVCNASPAADLAAPLLTADAMVNLESGRAKRSVRLADFLIGRRQTAREPDELVTGLSVTPRQGRTGDVYLKVGRRGAMEVALVGLSTRLMLDDSDRVEAVAIAVCSVAPVPYRASEAEEVLKGTRLEAEAIREAAAVLATSASPVSDFRADARYRTRVLGALLERALRMAAERAAA
ncbi:MAG: xanthine dehydrogenase family protein subunit M [Acidimicrobiia bacterium]